MEMMVNLILLAGLCSFSLCTSQNQFIFFPTPKNWTEAQTYCRENCIDLATTNDMDELNDILQIVEGKYDDALWFGLKEGTTRSWHWSLTGTKFYKKGEEDYLQWSVNPVNNCGSIYQGQLSALPCSNLLPSVCFDVTAKGKDQHILIQEPMSWTGAQNYCRTNHTDLTSVRNYAELGVIQGLAVGQRVWIGYFGDTWEWSDQTASSLRFWPPNQSVWSVYTDSCGAFLLAESGRWGGRNCSETHPFVCSCNATETKQRLIKVRISPKDSTLDLNDPAVLNSILEQMMLKLNKDGMSDEKLQWKTQPDGRVFIKETPLK
ncbi:lymphocyte antigen 75-like [Melanotaenia boesemani]|uniref:lymphocyte antigen 75-like n=1 Tax=Melanotaenia boesemani TaxID=1250792 RepID=UPI001C043C23|nr:lymphocyte antigen 75-like [Melanotaenia boesemani]